MADHQALDLSMCAALPSDLLDALRQPFAPDEVRLRIGRIRQTAEGGWQCELLPFVEARTCEARLDQVVPGAWSTTSPALVVTANQLTIAAQVRIGAIIHTAYAELPLPPDTIPHAVEELLVSVPDAFDHAFVRACARFGLGRYVADLARIWVPYDAEHRRVALSTEQQQAHILALYQQAHLPVLPRREPLGGKEKPSSATPERPTSREVTQDQGRTSVVSSPPLSQAALRAEKIAWVREQCAAHPGSLARMLTHWQVSNLDALSDDNLRRIVVSIQQSLARTSSNRS